MRQIVLVHHGDAVGPDVDPMRPLSTLGRAATDRIASAAALRGVKPDAIWPGAEHKIENATDLPWSID